LAGVNAALAYCRANREQVGGELAADWEEAARIEAEFARVPRVA
jgi:hypothetical protein